MGEMVQITATVVGYVRNAMRDEYDNGSFAVFDATELDVASPATFGKSLKVFHNQSPPEDSLWRRPGSRVTFMIDRMLLEKGYRVFSAAVKGLRQLDKDVG